MLYLVAGFVYAVILIVFMLWWHGICEDGKKADESFRQYVDGKAAKEAEKETALEKYYKQHPKAKP